MDKTWTEVDEIPVETARSDFVRALRVWICKPHVINRRLCGIKPFFDKDGFGTKDVEELVEAVKDVLPNIDVKNQSERLEENLLRIAGVMDPSQTRIEARKLLARHPKHTNGAELVFLDTTSASAVFLPFYESNDYSLTPKFIYLLQLIQKEEEQKIVLSIPSSPVTLKTDHSPAIEWLRVFVLPKLKKWSENQPDAPIVPSLKAVSVDKYNELYLHLKAKYGQELVKKWQEKTDPYKYVFEDIAIATYLLILWEQERIDRNPSRKQTFIDLGCGNGLLVHILVNEGHSGCGLDVRKRKIWDSFKSNVILKESAIVLSPLTKYPEYDWLIGNHSDELTPWIPVFAARSSYNTRFFLLPCCCYDFSSKFQRPNSVLSQYRSYLNYVQEISRICGFEITEDKLRIPSTKRICLIGTSRNYVESAEKSIDEKRLAFIKGRCSGTAQKKSAANDDSFLRNELSSASCIEAQSAENSWNINVEVRAGKEPVRNCTQLDRKLIETIIDIIAKVLVGSCDSLVSVPTDDGNVKRWNPGGILTLAEAVNIIGKDHLSRLKKECGGLQTLLRNHGHIFRIFQGTVSFRNYYCDQQESNSRRRSRTIKAKTKSCWFYENHPDGCPVVSEHCKFLH